MYLFITNNCGDGGGYSHCPGRTTHVEIVGGDASDFGPGERVVSSQQWQADHDAAVAILETGTCKTEEVKMHCEVEVLTSALNVVREAMQEVKMVVSAGSGSQLYAQIARPQERPPTPQPVRKDKSETPGYLSHAYQLVQAAVKGHIGTVKKYIAEKNEEIAKVRVDRVTSSV